MDSAVLDLKPRGTLDVLDLAVRTYRRNFAGLLTIGALVLVPTSIVHTVGQFFFTLGIGDLQQTGPTPSFQFANTTYIVIGLAIVAIWFVATAIGWPLSEGALTISVSEQYLGREITFKEAYRRALPFWFQLVWVGLVFGLLVAVGPMFGMVLGAGAGLGIGLAAGAPAGPLGAIVGALGGSLLGIPLAVLFTVWFIFYNQAMVIEDVGGIESLQRSRSLVQGHGWHVFGALLLAWIGIMAVQTILSIPAGVISMFVAQAYPEMLAPVQLASQVVQHVVNVLIQPAVMVLQTVLFYDLKIRKEGFDLRMMAAALHPGEEYVPAPPLQAETGWSPLSPAPPPMPTILPTAAPGQPPSPPPSPATDSQTSPPPGAPAPDE